MSPRRNGSELRSLLSQLGSRWNCCLVLSVSVYHSPRIIISYFSVRYQHHLEHLRVRQLSSALFHNVFGGTLSLTQSINQSISIPWSALSFKDSHQQCQTVVRPLTQQCQKVWSYLHTIPLKPDFARLWKSSLIAMSDVWPFFYRKLVLSSAVELIHIASIICMANCRRTCEQSVCFITAFISQGAHLCIWPEYCRQNWR